MNQRFDTQIHILDYLTNRINWDQQNLRELTEIRHIQNQVEMKVIITQLKQSDKKVNTLISTVDTLLGHLAAQRADQNDHYKNIAKWQGRMELKINQLRKLSELKKTPLICLAMIWKNHLLTLVVRLSQNSSHHHRKKKVCHLLGKIDQILEKEINDDQTK